MSAWVRTTEKQIFPRPYDGEVVYETPPCLSWIRPSEDRHVTVTVTQNGREIFRCETELNYAVPDRPLPPGEYEWNVVSEAVGERGTQKFTVAQDATVFLRPTAEELLAATPEGHPRHLFSKEDITTLISEKPLAIEALRENVRVALAEEIPEPPRYHRDPNALPYREYFGAFRDFCDTGLVALSLAYALLDDKAAGDAARERLLWICDLAPQGPASLDGPWGDEVGLSLARCLPSIYDLLYPLLSEKERSFVAETVALYAEQCERRLRRIDFCENPGSSHTGRLPAYLGEAALVLKGSGVRTDAELTRWLTYALEIYGSIFPYYGGTDGAWAEGAFYATSYTRWYLPFFSAVERYTGKSFLARPFYRHLTNYFLHFANPKFENHPFGDGYWCKSEDAEWPGFFAQSPLRYYADRFGPSLARKRLASETPTCFRLHLLDAFLPNPRTSLPEAREAKSFEVFSDVGYISMHTDLENTEEDIACLVRASRFGSDSHRHPDQGGFALFAGGVSLVSPSGYFGRRYGTKHHREWLNASIAHNVPIIGGHGQYQNSHLAVGKILSTKEEDGKMTATVSAGDAYPIPVKWERSFVLSGKTLTVTDRITAPEPVSVTYPLHFLSMPTLDEGGVLSLSRKGRSLTVRVLSGLDGAPTISDRFGVDLNDGEPAEYHVTMPLQFHAYFAAEEKREHEITVAFEIDG